MPQDLSALDWPARTARLSIRPVTPEDLGPMFDIRSLPEVAEWLPILPTDRETYRERMLHPDRMAVTFVLELDRRMIGDVYLALGDAWAQVEVADDAHHTQAEIGWVVAPEHTGNGYATEAAHELMRICFEDLGLRRVLAKCYADNVPSWRIMEKLGMRREEHTVRESLHRSGRWLDGLGYALLAEEWQALEAQRRGEQTAPAAAHRASRTARDSGPRDGSRTTL